MSRPVTIQQGVPSCSYCLLLYFPVVSALSLHCLCLLQSLSLLLLECPDSHPFFTNNPPLSFYLHSSVLSSPRSTVISFFSSSDAHISSLCDTISHPPLKFRVTYRPAYYLSWKPSAATLFISRWDAVFCEGCDRQPTHALLRCPCLATCRQCL